MTTTMTSGDPGERAGAREREARVKRLLLVGALGSFLTFFGLTVVTDAVSQRSTTQASAPVLTSPANPAPAVAPVERSRPHVRTRTS